MIVYILKLLFGLVVFVLAISLLIVFFDARKPNICKPDPISRSIAFDYPDASFSLPAKLISLCIETPTDKSAILVLNYPDFSRSARLNWRNREKVLSQRITVTFSAGRSLKESQAYLKKNLERRLLEKNKDGTLVYKTPPITDKDGLKHYNADSGDPVRDKDIYIIERKDGEIKTILVCGSRVVEGGYCRSEEIFIAGATINYSFDITHLPIAITLDQQVKDFIENFKIR